MFCTSCGQPNNSGVAFCAHCGAKVIAPPSKAKASSSLVETVSAVPKASSQRPTIVWVAIGLIGAGLVLCFIPYAAWLGWGLVVAGVVCAQVVFSKYPTERARGLNRVALALGYTGAGLLLIVGYVSYLRVPPVIDVGKAVLEQYYSYTDISCNEVPSMAIVDTFQPDVAFDCLMTGGGVDAPNGAVVEVHFNWYTGVAKWNLSN